MPSKRLRDRVQSVRSAVTDEHSSTSFANISSSGSGNDSNDDLNRDNGSGVIGSGRLRLNKRARVWDRLGWKNVDTSGLNLGSFDESVFLGLEAVSGDEVKRLVANRGVELSSKGEGVGGNDDDEDDYVGGGESSEDKLDGSSDSMEVSDKTSGKDKKKKEKMKKKKKKNSAKKIVFKAAYLFDTDASASWHKSSALMLHPALCSSLLSLNFASPTSIQDKLIPKALFGKTDLVGVAETGSGKTLSFVIPIFQYVISNYEEMSVSNRLLALILSPTRELALQTMTVIKDLDAALLKQANSLYAKRELPAFQIDDEVNGSGDDISVEYTLPERSVVSSGLVVGGLSELKQRRVLTVDRRPLHILVSTPGRLGDLIKALDDSTGVNGPSSSTASSSSSSSSSSSLASVKFNGKVNKGGAGKKDVVKEEYNRGFNVLNDLSHLKFLIIDEIDRMVEDGHYEELHKILDRIVSHEKIRQTGQEPMEYFLKKKEGDYQPEYGAAGDGGNNGDDKSKSNSNSNEAADDKEEEEEDYDEDGLESFGFNEGGESDFDRAMRLMKEGQGKFKTDDDDDDDDEEDEERMGGDGGRASSRKKGSKDNDEVDESDDDVEDEEDSSHGGAGSMEEEGKSAETYDDDSKPSSSSSFSLLKQPSFESNSRKTLVFSATAGTHFGPMDSVSQSKKRIRGIGEGAVRNLPVHIQELLARVSVKKSVDVVDVTKKDNLLLLSNSNSSNSNSNSNSSKNNSNSNSNSNNSNSNINSNSSNNNTSVFLSSLPKNLKHFDCKVPLEDKDLVLYHYLIKYTGRVLIFVNSIIGARRLDGLLRALEIPCRVLHGQMDQKNRFKSIEHFKSMPQNILVCTDVASRGLDLPRVGAVIHYDVARTTQTYIHRSGRTLRGVIDESSRNILTSAKVSEAVLSEGVSLSLISPEDFKFHEDIKKDLDGDRAITASAPSCFKHYRCDLDLLPMLKDRITLARKIFTKSFVESHKQKENSWIKSLAKETGLDLDSAEVDGFDMDHSATATTAAAATASAAAANTSTTSTTTNSNADFKGGKKSKVDSKEKQVKDSNDMKTHESFLDDIGDDVFDMDDDDDLAFDSDISEDAAAVKKVGKSARKKAKAKAAGKAATASANTKEIDVMKQALKNLLKQPLNTTDAYRRALTSTNSSLPFSTKSTSSSSSSSVAEVEILSGLRQKPTAGRETIRQQKQNRKGKYVSARTSLSNVKKSGFVVVAK